MLDVNLTGAFLTVRAALPDMTRRDAAAGQARRIVFVASTAGLQGFAYVSAYCAAKHGVVGLMRALAVELARTGVTVNAVCPGYTETPMLDASVAAIVGATGRSRERRAGRRSPRPIPAAASSRPPRWRRRCCGSARPGRVRHRQAIAITGGGRMSATSPVARPGTVTRAPRTASKQRLRLWLRLLRAARAIEGVLRERLRLTLRHDAAAVRRAWRPCRARRPA